MQCVYLLLNRTTIFRTLTKAALLPKPNQGTLETYLSLWCDSIHVPGAWFLLLNVVLHSVKKYEHNPSSHCIPIEIALAV